MSGPITFRDVEVGGGPVDVVTADGVVLDVRPPAAGPPGGEVVDGGGAALVPGLHDHHVHLLALAASLTSVRVGPHDVAGEAGLGVALRAAPPGASGWVRAVGYHDEVAGPLDRYRLDAVVDDRPVRVQHRSGGMWVLNTRALESVGLLAGTLPDGVETDEGGQPTGRLFRLDVWLRSRVPGVGLDLGDVGDLLVGHGVTGVTETTPWTSWADARPLFDAVGDGTFVPHVTVTGGPELDPAAAPTGVAVGPAKLLLPDHDLPSPDTVAGSIAAAREYDRCVAVHCVTRAALIVTLAAFDEAGSRLGDRIEHGAVVPPEMIDHLRHHRVTVVTQPGFVAERGDQYRAEVDADDLDHLWPCESLLEAGIPVAFGSDAPFGPLDPWGTIDAAVTRRTTSGSVLGGHEAVTPPTALDLYLSRSDEPGGPPRRVRPGERTDLCLLDRPLADALATPRDVRVRGVVVDGHWRATDTRV